MKRNFRISALIMLTMVFLFANTFAYADINDVSGKDVGKKLEANIELVKSLDGDNNKIFDNLETNMAKAYDNAEIPVIVMYKDNMNDNNLMAAKDASKSIIGDKKIKYEYSIIPGMALSLTKNEIKELAKQDYIKQIEYDAPVHATMNTARDWFGVTKAVADFGVNGDRDGNPQSYSTTDVVVAVIDTGIDASHVDLDGGKVLGWNDLVNNQTTPYDDNGHGTHCSSIVAGTGEGNANYKGVAPGAALVGVKVLDSQGSGSMSNVTAGIDWAVQNKDLYGIKVISLSLGTSTNSDGTDSTSVAVNNAYANGIAVCVAAGNSGPKKNTVGSPAAAANAITVGAMGDVGEKGYNLAYFSSRGPTADNRIKPDVAAPGVNIMAAEANSTSNYVSMSGTSMATPFTAGVAALMYDANYNLTPAQVKSIITSTAIDWGPTGVDNDYGYGRLDGYEAIKAAGGFTGTNITTPAHLYAADSIATAKKSDYWTFNVTNTSYPIAITFIMPNWTGSSTPDFDIYLYDANNNQLASATGTKRQETINFTPTATGTYKIKVLSYAGTGNYFFDLSTGGSNLVRTSNDI